MAKTPAAPAPKLFTAAGDVQFPYQAIGLIMATVVREEAGCGGGLPVTQALHDATSDLQQQAYGMGGNGVIHIQFMHRTSAAPGCGNQSKQSIEVYAWGTAIKY